MIGFSPPKTTESLMSRIVDVAKSSFALAQSALDVTNAIKAAFAGVAAGSKTLTNGATAPDAIQNTAATRHIAIVESDGKVTYLLGWR